jgi:hypothetical protein
MLFLPTVESPDSWGWGGTFVEEEASASPDTRPEPTVRILIIGETESGKSTIMKSIVRQFSKPDRPVYVINDRTPESLPPSHERKEWAQVPKLEFCTLVFEDIINCKRDQFGIIQDVLNYKAHHAHCGLVICIAHSLHKTGMYGLLPYFNFVYIAARPSSVRSFKALLREYDFPLETRPAHVQRLASVGEKYVYCVLDVGEGAFKMTRADEDHVSLLRKKHFPNVASGGAARGVSAAETGAAKYMGHLPNAQNRMRLFDIIYPALPKHRFDSGNLTVVLRDRKFVNTRISLIDYISALTDETFATDAPLLKLHRYLKTKKKLCLPKTFASNSRLW